MKRKGRLPELLAPAGNMTCLYAAVAGGADAVYVGGRTFSARAYAGNFDIEELEAAVSYCHLHGVKLYVTVNTLVYDREMRELSDFVAELWRIGVDAVITADLGVIREIKRRVPKLPIHASTQMSVHSTAGADAAARLGCERVVLARELSQADILSVTEKCAVETEIFLHGALCVSHSGQCLMSSLVGGRSGNRGECAQPCRLPYCNKYMLSLKDLSLADHIPALIESGVASLKIEGRMKSAEYVYTVTSIYRRLLDEGRAASDAENAELRNVFSRGGFTDSYYKDGKFSAMTGVRSERDKSNTKNVADMSFEPARVSVKASAIMRHGVPSELDLTLGDRSVNVTGAVPTEAISAPLTSDGVKARLSKMGGTMVSLDIDDIELVLDGGINLPPSAINALRREAVEKLVNFTRAATDSVYMPEGFEKSRNSVRTAQFFKKDTYTDLMAERADAADFFDIAFLPLLDFEGESAGVWLPSVFTDRELDEVKALLASAKERGAEYALVGNIGQIELVLSLGLKPIGDFRLNITNSGAMQEYRSLGIYAAVLSPELTLPMARDIGGGEIVYGRIPLMLTERCFIKENFGCEKCGGATLTDRTGAKFTAFGQFGHRNVIFNSLPTYMGDRKDELRAARITHEHFIFTAETADTVARVVEKYRASKPLGEDVRRIGRR